MRVSLFDRDSKQGILVDALSIDDNEGIVRLDTDEIHFDTEYVLQYEFYEKEILSNQDLPEVQFSASNTECKMPFVTQELLLIDRTVLKQRAKKYNEEKKDSIQPLNKLSCNFKELSNLDDTEFGEDGLYCQTKEYYYDLPTQDKELVKIYERGIDIRGSKNQVISYWFDLTFGYNFAVGSGMKVLLQSVDNGINAELKEMYEDDYPINSEESCLLDKSCMISRMSNKNEIIIKAVLTSGKYKLTVYDHQKTNIRSLLSEEINLKRVPLTVKVETYPVIQNEERENCPYMFMQSDFIQNRFIEGMEGQKFVYKDKVILNIFNLTQQIDIKPEVDSILKMRVKEAFGVNSNIVLYNSKQEVVEQSGKAGSTQILMAKVKKQSSYTIELSYKNSIIEFADFFTCPFLHLEISMIPESEVKSIVSKQECNKELDFQYNSKLGSIFNDIIETEGSTSLIYSDQNQIFKYYVKQDERSVKTQNFHIDSFRFKFQEKHQLFAEIFYDEYLYDLEIYLEALEMNLVRDHVYKNIQKVDWSLYKGAKSIFVELDPGMYEMYFVQKLPLYHKSKDYLPDCVEFQFHLRVAPEIQKETAQIPPSLNFLGMLGPQGSNFGQMIYFCQDCVISNTQKKEIYFSVDQSKSGDADFDAIISSPNNNVGLTLEEVEQDIDQQQSKSGSKDNKNVINIVDDDEDVDKGGVASNMKNMKKYKGKVVGKRKEQLLGEEGNEIEIKDAKIGNKKMYRIIITNKDYHTFKQATFNLKIEITENSYKPNKKRFQEKLPSKINDIMRYKLKAEGLKESEFIVGTKFLLEFMNEQALHPFVPKSNTIYMTKAQNVGAGTQKTFSLKLPFTIEENEAEVFGSLIDYSYSGNLQMYIYKTETTKGNLEENYRVATSIPLKYHTFLAPITLTKGQYILLVEPDGKFFDSTNKEEILKFSLDFVYEKEVENEEEIILDSLELCEYPDFPFDFNTPQYIHALSGYGMEIFQEFKISELLNGGNLRFTLPQTSLVTFYMELPKEMEGGAELMKNKGTHRLLVTTSDLNSQNDNFLRTKDLAHQNVIEFREFLNSGTYDLWLHSNSQIVSFDFEPRCQPFKVGFSVTPISKIASFGQNDKCYESTSLISNLEFNKLVTGNLTYDTSSTIFDTSYITTSENGEGPFLFYFNINYETQVEGPLALVLSKYSSEDLQFREVALYEVQNSQSQIIAIIDEGTFVLSIQTLSSTIKKFTTNGLPKSQDKSERKLFNSPCLKVQYQYIITSLNVYEANAITLDFGFEDILAALFLGDLSIFDGADDLVEQSKFDNSLIHDLNGLEQYGCQFDQVPKSFPISDVGYDVSYVFPVGEKNYDIIDIVSDTPQLFKLFLKPRNSRSNVNAFIYENGDYKNLIVSTESMKGHKQLLFSLKPQKRAYKLKLIYDSIDQKSACPTYDLRIAMKPIDNIVKEDLKCEGLELPPESISTNGKDFDLDQEFAISSSFITKYQDQREISYDIEINTKEKKGFHFDIETRFQFLTSGIHLELYYQNNEGQYVSIASSKWFNEYLVTDNFNNNDYYDQRDFVNRLTAVSSNQDLSEGESLTEIYLLRIRFSKDMQKILNMFDAKKVLTKENPLCFPFDLSIRITDQISTPGQDKGYSQVELIRVEWPQKQPGELIDIRKKLTIFLEFDGPVQQMYRSIKFEPVVYIEELSKQGIGTGKKLYPSSTRMSVVDKTSIILSFKQNTLNKGVCYQFKVENQYSFNYNQDLLKNQTKFCTSSCLCNKRGTSRCEESRGVCLCRFPYLGVDCASCQPGYFFDQLTQQCLAVRKCKESGGNETCNGHGACTEDPLTGQAKCICNPGFAHDGEEYCAKCQDPLFQYPDCLMRNWIIEDSDINCKNLPIQMPVHLYSYPEGEETQTTIYQNDEGLLSWYGRYKLQKYENQQKSSSSHYFIVQHNSIFRVFLDSLKSGTKFAYKILDNNKNILYSSSTQNKQFVSKDQTMLVIRQPLTYETHAHPFEFQIDYEFEKSVHDKSWCSMMEIFMIVQPFEKIQQYLKCSQDDIKNSLAFKQFSWIFGSESKQLSEKFTLNSDMLSGKNNEDGYISEENENFLTMTYQFQIEESGNALSVIAAYHFETVALSLSLINLKTGLVAIETISSLEDIQGSDNVFSKENDMTSYIEIPDIEEGLYELRILIRKGLFLPTQAFRTCLNFDLTFEYIVRQKSLGYQQENENLENQQYQILSIYPTQAENMKVGQKKKIEIQFNKKIDLDQLMTHQNDIHQICYLENIKDSKVVLYPNQEMITGKTNFDIYFDFKKIKFQSDDDRCYKLKCTTQYTKLGVELIQKNEIDTLYCFASKNQEEKDSLVDCNPNAMAKVIDNKCVCPHPYQGSLCEECAVNFIPKVFRGHTECILDSSKCSDDICNGHGECLRTPTKNRSGNEIFTDEVCKCQEKYDGRYCERCANSSLAYPDCDASNSADMYDEIIDKEYLNRRKYNMEGYVKPKENTHIKNVQLQQCPQQSFPRTLDAVEYMQFMGGDFHVADYYTINHDKDNLIELTPRKEGVLKIYISQPQIAEMTLNDESFDLEIALLDKISKKFLATSMNGHLNLGPQIDGKLEYASLYYEIPKMYVNHTLLLMFRALNFSVSAQQSTDNCQDVYMEIEFAEKPRECLYNNLPETKTQVVQVTKTKPYSTFFNSEEYSVYGEDKQFFYYQDFYVGDDLEENDQDKQEMDYEIVVSIQQKFMELNQIDFLIETITYDIDYTEIQVPKTKKPNCKGICLISGSKSFNEMHTRLELASRTYFRVWLFQSQSDGSCANFQLFVESNVIDKKAKKNSLNSNFKCEELDLPETLNTERYLGSIEKEDWQQQDFHILERFRVDSLRNSSSGHKLRFNLQEPTLVRFSAPVHKHIDFDLELREVFEQDGKKKSRKLIFSTAKDFEDTIFAQLDRGAYYLRLVFISPEFYLEQPCQSVQLEMAMMSLKNLKSSLLPVTNKEDNVKEFSVEKIFETEFKEFTIYAKDLIKVHEISKQQQGFATFITLYETDLALPSKEALGIMISSQSNFLLNDINFALTHQESGTIYHNLKRESQNKLIIEDLPAGQYEFLIYAHNCLTNIQKDYIKSLDIYVQIDINLVRWSSQLDDLSTKSIVVDEIGDGTVRKFKASLDNLHPQEIQCFSENLQLPSFIDGTAGLIKGVDIDNTFMFNQIGYYTTRIQYKASKGENYLKVVVDRANTRIKLFKSGNSKEETRSFATNAGELQVLIATNIIDGQLYEILFEFDENESVLDQETKFCEEFKMQIKSGSNEHDCHPLKNGYSPERGSKLSFEGEGYYELPIEMQTGNRFNQTLVLKKNNFKELEVELTVDYSYAFFVQSISLFKVVQSNEPQLNEIKPYEIMDDIKNLIRFRYDKVEAYETEYLIMITLYRKPAECSTQFNLKIEISPPEEKLSIFDKDFMGIMQQYNSELEIQDLNRYVEDLPISLDNYKYLTHEDYILVSEYIQLTADDKEKNRISFTIETNRTLFRLYLENDDVLLSLKELTTGNQIQDEKSNSLWGILNQGKYQVDIDFFTEITKKKVMVRQDKIHMTLILAKEEVYEQKYPNLQGSRIKNCENNKNFPLALNKIAENPVYNEAIYSYPILRLSQEVLFERFVIDSYNFRVNETSRFYFSLGMHFLSSHLTISLSDMKSVGEEYLGKQSFNINELDVIIPAGDYVLVVSQPSLFESPEKDLKDKEKNKIKCGLYSINVQIQPLTKLESQGKEVAQSTTQSKCPIKEMAPMKIYSSEAETKAGGEYFINKEGQFFKQFNDVLYKKTSTSQVNPEYDRIIIEAKEESLFSVMVQYKTKGNYPMVKLHDSFGFDKDEQVLSFNQQSVSGKVMQESSIFRLMKGHSYTLFIYYGGELNFNQDGKEVCEYYNLYLQISYLSLLQEELKCVGTDDKHNHNLVKEKKVLSFRDDIPAKLSDVDLDFNNTYEFTHFMELKYPQDYVNPRNPDKLSQVLFKQIEVTFTSEFDIFTEMEADYPHALFGISILDISPYSEEKQNGVISSINEMLPTWPVSNKINDPTLSSKIRTKQQDANSKQLITYSDYQSKTIFEVVQNYTNRYKPLGKKGENITNEYCMYFDFTLSIKKKKSGIEFQNANKIPLITSITPQMTAMHPISILATQQFITIGIEFDQPPFIKKTQSAGENKKPTSQALQEVINLLIYNPNNAMTILYRLQPVEIQLDKQSQKYFKFVFNVQDEVIKSLNQDLTASLYINQDFLVNQEGARFQLDQGVIFPVFAFPDFINLKQKIRESEENESEILQQKIKLEEEIKNKEDLIEEVKCLCVHGKCNKGSSKCNKCDQGWEGVLCDIKIQAKNINQDNSKGKMNRNNRIGVVQEEIHGETKKSDVKPASSNYQEPYHDVPAQPPHTQQPEKIMGSPSMFYNAQQAMTDFFVEIFGLIYQVLLICLLLVALYLLAVYINKKRNEMRYQKLPQKEEDDGNNSTMELTELQGPKRSQQRQSPPQRVPQQRHQFDEDPETKKLVSELKLYSDQSEQDQALMQMHHPSPNRYDDEQPQQKREQGKDPHQEIEDVLKEMNEFDEGDDDETHQLFGN